MLRFLCTVLAIACLCLSFEQKEKKLPLDTKKLSVFVDVSESMDKQYAARVYKQLQAFADKTELFVTPFSGSCGSTYAFRDVQTYAELLNKSKELNRERSNVACVLEASEALLITDGWHNTGSFETSEHARIHALIPEEGVPGLLQLKEFTAPRFAAREESVEILFTVVNYGAAEKQIKVEVLQDENSLYSKELKVKAQEVFTYTLESLPIKNTDTAFEIVVTSPEQELRRKRFVKEKQQERILLLSRLEKEEKELKRIIEQSGYVVKSYMMPGENISHVNLQDFELIVFNNVAKSEVPRTLPANIKEYVEQGGRFLMLGGNKSFGLGGYRYSALEEILPVRMIPPKREEERYNVAVQLLIDKSYSMQYEQKMDYAKLAAREVIRNLKDDDHFGLIGFEDEEFIVRRLSPLKGQRELAEKRVGLLFPAGGTVLLPALNKAFRSLERARASRKHLIILTDGKLPDAYTNSRYYLQMVSDMRFRGITVSTFLIGMERGELLEEMAAKGGGAFHRTRQAGALPRLFVDDLKRRTADRTKNEEGMYTVRSKASFPHAPYPSVYGFVETKLKEGASLALDVLKGRKTSPLLAFYNVKKGKTAAFTSDLNGRWSKKWYQWPALRRFLRTVFDTLDIESAGEKLDIDVHTEVLQGELKGRLEVYSEHDPEALELFIKEPKKKIEKQQLLQKALGSYLFDVLPQAAGEHVFELRYKGELVSDYTVDVPAVKDVRGLGVNRAFIEELVYKTGGELNPDVRLFEDKAAKPLREKELRLNSFFLYAAFLFICIEILLRTVFRRGTQRKMV